MATAAAIGAAAAISKRPTNRAMRRRPALVQAAAEASCRSDPAAAGFEGQRRLETHVWHARRMTMRPWCELARVWRLGDWVTNNIFLGLLLF